MKNRGTPAHRTSPTAATNNSASICGPGSTTLSTPQLATEPHWRRKPNCSIADAPMFKQRVRWFFRAGVGRRSAVKCSASRTSTCGKAEPQHVGNPRSRRRWLSTFSRDGPASQPPPCRSPWDLATSRCKTRPTLPCSRHRVDRGRSCRDRSAAPANPATADRYPAAPVNGYDRASGMNRWMAS